MPKGNVQFFFVSDEGAGIETSTSLQWANKQSHMLTQNTSQANTNTGHVLQQKIQHTRQTDCVHECQEVNTKTEPERDQCVRIQTPSPECSKRNTDRRVLRNIVLTQRREQDSIVNVCQDTVTEL